MKYREKKKKKIIEKDSVLQSRCDGLSAYLFRLFHSCFANISVVCVCLFLKECTSRLCWLHVTTVACTRMKYKLSRKCPKRIKHCKGIFHPRIFLTKRNLESRPLIQFVHSRKKDYGICATGFGN